MSWLVDYANNLYLLLAIVAAGFATAFWITKRVRFLGYAGGTLALMGLIWLIAHFSYSDKKQLELNVRAMAKAIVDGNTDDLMKHIATDFRHKQMTREVLHEKAKAAVKMHRVSDIKITKFKVESVSREKKMATTSFTVTAWGAGDDMYMFGAQGDFVLEGDQWKLKTLRFYKAFVDADREIDLPLP